MRGWYDAGDYGKYIVNSGITVFTLLELYEHFPAFMDTLQCVECVHIGFASYQFLPFVVLGLGLIIGIGYLEQDHT